MIKATFRLPDWELERMRERSREERRSLNAVAADVIARGLGQSPTADEDVAVATLLGPLLARPALRRHRSGRTDAPVQLTEALDWTRGDR